MVHHLLFLGNVVPITIKYYFLFIITNFFFVYFLGSPKEENGLKMVGPGFGVKCTIIVLMVELVVEDGKGSQLNTSLLVFLIVQKKLSKHVGILQNNPQRPLISGKQYILFYSAFSTFLFVYIYLICLLFRTCDKKCMVPDEFGDEIMLSVDMGLYLKFQTKKEWGGRVLVYKSYTYT